MSSFAIALMRALPHWMMALTAAGRREAAGCMLEAMRAFASGGSGTAAAPLVRNYALPIGEVLAARASGEPGQACDLMRPALDGMHRLGGSHAQQDVLWQPFLDCAFKAGRAAGVAAVLARMASRHPVAPEKRVGYAGALSMVH